MLSQYAKTIGKRVTVCLRCGIIFDKETEDLEMENRRDSLMHQREKIIQLWFRMWLLQQDLGIDEIFADDVVYIESWGPVYSDRKTVKHWFQEWNMRGKVLIWEIKQFFHSQDQTVVEWYFKNQMKDGSVEAFDGMSLIVWTEENKIKMLKEFGCNRGHYNPYQNGDQPVFREEQINWF